MRVPMPPSTTMMMRLPEFCQAAVAGADILGMTGGEKAGEAGEQPGDHIGDQPVAEDVETNGSHAQRVLLAGAQHAAKARDRQPADKEPGRDEDDEGRIEQAGPVEEWGRAEKGWRVPQGQSVIATIGGQRRQREKQHLAESQCDHDEIDARGAQRYRPGHQGEQPADQQHKAKQRHHIDDAFGERDACDVGAEPEKRRMAEADQAAVADQKVERYGGDRQDHRLQNQVENVVAAGELGDERHQRQKHHDRYADQQRAICCRPFRHG